MLLSDGRRLEMAVGKGLPAHFDSNRSKLGKSHFLLVVLKQGPSNSFHIFPVLGIDADPVACGDDGGDQHHQTSFKSIISSRVSGSRIAVSTK